MPAKKQKEVESRQLETIQQELEIYQAKANAVGGSTLHVVCTVFFFSLGCVYINTDCAVGCSGCRDTQGDGWNQYPCGCPAAADQEPQVGGVGANTNGYGIDQGIEYCFLQSFLQASFFA